MTQPSPSSNIPCKNWRDNGWCRFEENCRFSHDGPRGKKRPKHFGPHVSGTVEQPEDAYVDPDELETCIIC